jgi:hypothetical protein
MNPNEDFDILINEGNIAFYQSCEVTELFLYNKDTVFNFYTIAVFEEKPFNERDESFLTPKPIKINKDYNLGIKRSWHSLDEIKNTFATLVAQNKWVLNGNDTSKFPQLNKLPKQFIPSTEGNRLNNILKNNFHNGSYIIEFFDEDKRNVDFLLKIDALKQLNKVSDTIKQFVPIDLAVVRDRIGNFIFQFPITLLETDSKAKSEWDGIIINFIWHNKVTNPPDCLLEVESKIEQNYLGCIIEEYNKELQQTITIGNMDQNVSIKIWKKEPNLILSTFYGSYIREFDFNMGITSHEPRIFKSNEESIKIEITSYDRNKKKKTDYTKYINSSLYDADKKKLEQSLSFKQYRGKKNDESLADLRKLITQHDSNGVYLWDPYLRANDILKTLFFSTKAGVVLRAIASTYSDIEKVYERKNKEPKDIILEERIIFENPCHNNFGLNFEFRMQHGMNGWKFHDRFLIFPGDELSKPKVYALGTSINSFGTEHNILQEVSHPQPVVDAFNELWDSLNKNDCIVWKFPK